MVVVDRVNQETATQQLVNAAPPKPVPLRNLGPLFGRRRSREPPVCLIGFVQLAQLV
jgi:hypothetical protein